MDCYRTTSASGIYAAAPPAQMLPGEVYHDPAASGSFSDAHTMAGAAIAGDVLWPLADGNHYTCNMSSYFEGAAFPRPALAHSTSAPIPPYPAAFHSDFTMEYMRGPTSEGSPLLSPQEDCITLSGAPGFGVTALERSSPLQYHVGQHRSFEEQIPIPEGVKMPQRKGGMQLWQFLYALLTDPESQYLNLIEWTTNRSEREFRLLQPEAIAVWWGHHKNKENMSYDKLSRSLRYYYDKGLLKKIPGERYVYRFCIDPERMYKHIGNSESRPKLKPMPQAAKLAISKSKIAEGEQSIELATNVYVAAPPESLAMPVSTSCSQVNASSHTDLTATTVTTASNSVLQVSGPSSNVPMRRCASLDTHYSRTSAWEQSSIPSNLSPLQHSLSLPDYRAVPDTSFYSPHSSPFGSPLSSNESCSSPPSTTFISEGSVYDTSCPQEYTGAVTYSTSSFYPPTSAEMTMWTFAQE